MMIDRFGTEYLVAARQGEAQRAALRAAPVRGAAPEGAPRPQLRARLVGAAVAGLLLLGLLASGGGLGDAAEAASGGAGGGGAIGYEP